MPRGLSVLKAAQESLAADDTSKKRNIREPRIFAEAKTPGSVQARLGQSVATGNRRYKQQKSRGIAFSVGFESSNPFEFRARVK